MKPTPRPWIAPERFEKDVMRNGEHDTEPVDFLTITLADGTAKDGCDYIEIGGENQKANAAHIVKCVNMHEALVEMLRQCETMLVLDGHAERNGQTETAFLRLVRAAIAKAEGGNE